MNKTTNYGLNLPEKGEFYDVELVNENTQAIDAKLKELEAGGDSLPISGGELTGTLITADVKPSANATLPTIGHKGNAYFGGYFNNLGFETSNGADAGSVTTVGDISGDGTTNAIIMSLGNDDTNTFGGIDVRSPLGGHANVTASGSDTVEVYFPPNSGTLALKEETLSTSGGTITNSSSYPLTILCTNENAASVTLQFSKNGTSMGRIGVTSTDQPAYVTTGGVMRTILHTGTSKPVAIQSSAPSDTTALWVY